MKNTIRFALAAAVSLVALEASAGGFAVREQSAFWQGTSFAGAATSGGGLSGMFWNPAVLGEVPGINTETDVSGIFGYAKISPTTGSGPLVANQPGSGNLGVPALVPGTYANYQINDRLFLGPSVNSPFGLKTKSDYGWAGQLYGRSTKATNIVATPTLAYKVNDWLSVGAGLQVGYLSTRLSQATGFALTSPDAILSGDSWGVGFTLGATLKPMAGTEIGIGYRSAVHYGLKGDIEFPSPLPRTPIKASINLPEMITIGLRQQLGQNLTLLGGFEWTNWSRAKTAAIYNTNTGIQASKLPFEYGDGYMASIGAEYAFNPNLTLRAGLAYEWSPVSDLVRSVRIPDNDRIWASLGATYKWNEKITLDAAYTHIFVKNVNVNIVAGNPHYLNPFVQLVGNGKAHVDIFAVSLRYRWDNPPARAAIVTKG